MGHDGNQPLRCPADLTVRGPAMPVASGPTGFCSTLADDGQDILLESGDIMLLESGDHIHVE